MNGHSIADFFSSCGTAGPLELIVSGPGRNDDEVVFEQPFALLGRHPSNSLRLRSDEIQPRHLYLQCIAGKALLIDLGSRLGLSWDGQYRRYGWLETEPPVHAGPFTLRLAAPLARDGFAAIRPTIYDWDPLANRVSDPQVIEPVTLDVSGPGTAHQSWQMSRALALVGNSAACRVRLGGDSVSTFHCSLIATRCGVWAVDLLSQTGTWLNGQSVRWARMAEGDLLQVGTYQLRCRYERHRHRRTWLMAGDAPLAADHATTSVVPFPAVIDQCQLMQQQLFELFQGCLVEMADTFASVYRQETAQVRGELQEVRQLVADLHAAQQTPQISAPVPCPDSPPDEPAPTVAAGEAAVAAPATPDAPAIPEVKAHEAHANPNGAGNHLGTETSLGTNIHTLLNQRLASLHSERQNMWKRFLEVVRGK